MSSLCMQFTLRLRLEPFDYHVEVPLGRKQSVMSLLYNFFSSKFWLLFFHETFFSCTFCWIVWPINAINEQTWSTQTYGPNKPYSERFQSYLLNTAHLLYFQSNSRQIFALWASVECKHAHLTVQHYNFLVNHSSYHKISGNRNRLNAPYLIRPFFSHQRTEP